MAKMIFAKQKDTRKIVGIDEVEKGLACNCVCPNCGAVLEARKGKIRVHHFAHYDKDETSFCSESALHLAAKEVLKEAREIALPALKISIDACRKEIEVLPDGHKFNYDQVEIEKSIFLDEELIRPDIVVYNSNDKATLAVEILVSHAVDEEKKQKIKLAKLTTIEIDLSVVDVRTKEELRSVLLNKTTNKKWIFSNQATYFENRVKAFSKKILISNSKIKNCPLGIWQGQQKYVSESKCYGCRYCCQIGNNYVVCLGEWRISEINDLKLNHEALQEHIEYQKIRECDDDKKAFSKGICPVCYSGLRVGKADDPYISCRNYNECKFTAVIDFFKYTAIFKNRVGEEVVVDLPEFVLNDVSKLQKEAAKEIDDIEELFPLGLCPYCAERLVIRDGKRGKFLGCKGYSNFDYSCQFTANLDFENMTAAFQTRYSPKRTIVKTIPENVIREYKMWKERKEAPRRQFLISENDRRDD